MFSSLVNILFPPRCLCCNKLVSEMGCLCHDCWIKIEFNNNLCCDLCGIPFAFEIGKNILCGNCIQAPPLYKKVYSVFRMTDQSKTLIHKLKYSDHTYFAPYLAKWMINNSILALEQADLIIAVPMHKLRLIIRLYNQASLLAKYISKLSGIRWNQTILTRSKFTKPQFGLNKKERQLNVADSFFINEKFKDELINKNIILVDDVMTTGATINACTKLLLKGGAKSVTIITLARTTID